MGLCAPRAPCCCKVFGRLISAIREKEKKVTKNRMLLKELGIMKWARARGGLWPRWFWPSITWIPQNHVGHSPTYPRIMSRFDPVAVVAIFCDLPPRTQKLLPEGAGAYALTYDNVRLVISNSCHPPPTPSRRGRGIKIPLPWREKEGRGGIVIKIESKLSAYGVQGESGFFQNAAFGRNQNRAPGFFSRGSAGALRGPPGTRFLVKSRFPSSPSPLPACTGSGLSPRAFTFLVIFSAGLRTIDQTTRNERRSEK